MKARLYILSSLVVWLSCVSCSEELEYGGPVQFCVRAAWENGRGEAGTRALTATDILGTSAPNPIEIDYDDYPATVSVKDSEGNAFELTKGDSYCELHDKFYNYTTDYKLIARDIETKNLRFTATATIDEEDELQASEAELAVGNHLQFTLHHTKALVRLAFKLHEDYDLIRQIQVTEVSFQDKELALATPVLISKDSKVICYTYVKPSELKVNAGVRLKCKYIVFDKDDAALDHPTRQDVVVENTFTFGGLKNGSQPVTSIEAGYYYDLNITLNPDYLYVLSDHDNKHLTVE